MILKCNYLECAANFLEIFCHQRHLFRNLVTQNTEHIQPQLFKPGLQESVWVAQHSKPVTIQHVVHEIVRVAVSDKPTIAIPADDAVELGVEIFKF